MDHAIDLVPNFKLIKSQIYPCSPMEQAEIDAFIDDQLAKGYICPSTSDQTSGVFFIPKKDGKSEWYKIIIISILKPLRTITHSP